MLMICWFYCVPFLKMLYYAVGPLMILFGAFALRRGIVRARPVLRQLAFILFFVALAKILVFDLRDLDQHLVCGTQSGVDALCTATGFKIIGVSGLVLFCAASYALFIFYLRHLPNLRPRVRHAGDPVIRRWANLAMAAVVVFIVWSLTPWVASLTVGTVPALFMVVPWQVLSLIGLGVVLTAFWKAEACDWSAVPRRSSAQHVVGVRRTSHAIAGWTPRDTLWMAVFLYLAAVGLAYVAQDVLGS